MALEQQSEHVWTLSRPFRVPLLGDIGSRMTILRLQGHELLLISPVDMDDADVQEIQALGSVKYIVAPNSMHYLFMKKAQALFPNAKLAGPPGLAEKCKDIPFNLVVSENNWLWKVEVDMMVLKAKSPVKEEIVFFHKKDRVLITTDFIFNLQGGQGFWSDLASRFNKTFRRLGMSRWGRKTFSDREILKRALRQIELWSPAIVIMAHGQIVREQATPRLLSSFSWMRWKDA